MTIRIANNALHALDNYLLIKAVREQLQKDKPNDRSESDRHHAIVITDMQKIEAYYKTWILEQGATDEPATGIQADKAPT